MTCDLVIYLRTYASLFASVLTHTRCWMVSHEYCYWDLPYQCCLEEEEKKKSKAVLTTVWGRKYDKLVLVISKWGIHSRRVKKKKMLYKTVAPSILLTLPHEDGNVTLCATTLR